MQNGCQNNQMVSIVCALCGSLFLTLATQKKSRTKFTEKNGKFFFHFEADAEWNCPFSDSIEKPDQKWSTPIIFIVLEKVKNSQNLEYPKILTCREKKRENK